MYIFVLVYIRTISPKKRAAPTRGFFVARINTTFALSTSTRFNKWHSMMELPADKNESEMAITS